jgi:PIN domain nuclease of toxin-antitoxin system
MILLVDAHALLWALAAGTSALSRTGRAALEDPENDVLVSAATVWEIAIKAEAGRLEAPDELLETIEATLFDVLPISGADAVAAARLPRLHADPFDRILVAQARRLDAFIVTRDRAIADSGVRVLTA